MKSPDELDFGNSLGLLMEGAAPESIAANAGRQKRTVDAILNRMFDSDPQARREMVLLADEVGLGKTFVALGVAWSVLVQRQREGLPGRPVLVVTSSAQALFRKWQREAETFFKQSVPEELRFEVHAVETPHALAEALSARSARLVIARMSAFDGQLHKYDTVIASALHGLFNFFDPELTVEQRLELTRGWSILGTRESVDRRGSGAFWQASEALAEAKFGEKHLKKAIRRLEKFDSRLMNRLRNKFLQVKRGDQVTGNLAADVREVARAALGERAVKVLPLVIVDEIHNWKNHPQSWQRFLHTLGGRVDRLLGLSATPFQLGSHELIQVLNLRTCLAVDSARSAELDALVGSLDVRLRQAHEGGVRLREAWSDVTYQDVQNIEAAWRRRRDSSLADAALPPRLGRAISAALEVENAHLQLMDSLRPFLIRHCRAANHRQWLVGRDALPGTSRPSKSSSLAWRPGLDVSGDAELVHYLMMRAVQEEKQGHGATSLGADLGGSYHFFRDSELKRMLAGSRASARPYLDLVEAATRLDSGHEHPKVAVTADRAFAAWLHGEKTLIFCFNVRTVDAVREAVLKRVHSHEAKVLARAFDCGEDEYMKRLENFQRRLYGYRQTVFLLFQDHPLAGCEGRVPSELCLEQRDVQSIAQKLAAEAPPAGRGRFDRRRVLAAAEQVLVEKWRVAPKGVEWLRVALSGIGDAAARDAFVESVLAPDWSTTRRSLVEGVRGEGEPEPMADDDGTGTGKTAGSAGDFAAWLEVLNGRAARAVLAPYLADAEVPSLLARWHARSMHELPIAQRALATFMLRRMVRSPSFLARFLLDDPANRPALASDDDESDGHWTTLIHSRWTAPPAEGESAAQRFGAYLKTLKKVAGREAHSAAYEDASRNREVVAKVTGAMSNEERDRHFTGFNTPLFPDVLIVTTVGQEGIDLHQECRHVIHHDLPWNPATLEQRTGRVDRIGSKAERLLASRSASGRIDVAVPYIANTYDENRFRRVHARTRLFEVTMGGEVVLEPAHHANEDDPKARVADDLNREDLGTATVPLPESMASALRMRLEA